MSDADKKKQDGERPESEAPAKPDTADSAAGGLYKGDELENPPKGEVSTDPDRRKEADDARQGEVVLKSRRDQMLIFGIVAGALVLLILLASLWWS